MHNIICTGNPHKLGLPKSVRERFPQAKFAHFSNGFDLTDFKKFSKEIINYNVFMNYSSFNETIQIDLLQLAVKNWEENNVNGHIFNFGSIIEYEFLKKINQKYHDQKINLRNTSIDFCSEKIKTTHIIIGGIQCEASFHNDKLDCKNIVDIIEYILNFQYHIPLVSIERIIDHNEGYRRCIK